MTKKRNHKTWTKSSKISLRQLKSKQELISYAQNEGRSYGSVYSAYRRFSLKKLPKFINNSVITPTSVITPISKTNVIKINSYKSIVIENGILIITI